MFNTSCYAFYFISVKEKLAVDLDSEIATTSLRISLLCPVRSPVLADLLAYMDCFVENDRCFMCQCCHGSWPMHILKFEVSPVHIENKVAV